MNLYQQLQTVLLETGFFDTDRVLRALCVDQRVHYWQPALPHADSPQDRVLLVVAFLMAEYHPETQENGLISLLAVLRQGLNSQDDLHRQLGDLIEQLPAQLAELKTQLPPLPKSPPANNLEIGNIGRDLSGNIAGRDINQTVNQTAQGKQVGQTVYGDVIFNQATQTYLPLQRPVKPDPFVDRETELATLLEQLQPGQTVTLCGPGGMGKTALASEALWHLTSEDNQLPAQFPDGIIFHSFYDFPQIDSALSHIILSLGGRPEAPLEQTAQRLLAGKQLLLLLDGAEDADNLPRLQQLTSGCGVIITSRRRQDAPNPQRRQDMTPLPLTEARNLLQSLGLTGAPAQLVDELCDRLGGLPLAVRLAGRYLAETGEPLTDYLAWLEETPIMALSHGQHRQESVELLLQRTVDRLSEPARQLLALTGVLALAPFKRAWLTSGMDVSFNQLRPALNELVGYGLLVRVAFPSTGSGNEPIETPPELAEGDAPPESASCHSERPTEAKSPPTDAQVGDSSLHSAPFRMTSGPAETHYQLSHALIHTYVSRRLPPPASHLEQLETTMLTEANELNNAGYPLALTWAGHLQAITDLALAQQHPPAADLANTLGYYLQAIARYESARPYYEQALSIWREVLGERHPDTALSLNNLGLLLDNMGDYESARPYYEQALSIRREVLGERHPDTAQSLNNLGALLRTQGDYESARPYLEQALSIWREVLGERHPDTALSLNNLGFLLHSQGDYESARPYYEQALSIKREVLGERHPDTALSLNNLGMLLKAQGDYESARPYLEQALSIWREVLGERHPDTASSLNNLGMLLYSQGDYESARPYYEQALSLRREVLGERHPDTALSLNNLGGLLQAQGDYESARPYYEQALSIWREVLGERHPDTARSLNNLGALLDDMGDYESARPYYEQALSIRREVLGERHPDTASSLNNLAILAYYQQDMATAAELMRQAVAICETVLGPDHPDTVGSRQSLAVIEAALTGS